jgi:hypothetical protein
MGMDQKVTFSPDRVPPWPRLWELLSARGLAPQLRMIDGELAFPDEEPAATWYELRVGTSSGMVTLRRESDGVRLVTWGNADDALRRAWNVLTWAVAELSDGTVDAATGPLCAAEFAKSVKLEG